MDTTNIADNNAGQDMEAVLTLRVRYAGGQDTPHAARDTLSRAVEHLAGEGLLSGEMSSHVEAWEHDVWVVTARQREEEQDLFTEEEWRAEVYQGDTKMGYAEWAIRNISARQDSLGDLYGSLVTYEGGGYDGCFWEVNCAFIDRQGNFHDIYTTGRYGRRSLDAINRLVDRSEREPHTLYDVYDAYDLDAFADDEPLRIVLKASRWFEENPEHGVSVAVRCDNCGRRVTASEVANLEHSPAGGIMIVPTSAYCADCDEEMRAAEEE